MSSSRDALMSGAGPAPRNDAEQLACMWPRPAQNEEYPRERQVEGVKAMMEKFNGWEADGGKPRTRLYLPNGPDHRSDLARVTTERPGDAAQWPGYECWDVVTTNAWLEQLTGFAQTSAFEMIDLQSDVTLAASIFIDEEYTGVPMKLKVTFLVVTVLSILLELAIAFQQALKAKNSNEPASRNWRYVAMSTYLNWIATPVSIIVAPKRFAAFGMHRFGRNIGSIVESAGLPIILSGQSGQIDYLQSRTFFVRLPKVFLENILLFALTVYIQHNYVGRWSAAALFSVASSTGSLLAALWKTLRFFRDAWTAKRYYEKVVKDQEGYIAPYDKKWAGETLKQGFISCPLL